MKVTVILALAALLAASGLQAQNGGLGGKWVAGSVAPETSQGNAGGAQGAGGALSQGGAGGGGFGCGGFGVPGPRGSFPRVCNDTGLGPLFPRMAPRVAELDLAVDLIKATVTGSINLPGQGKAACGRLKILEGRTNGQTLAFTTNRKINGSQIPTRWVGEIIGGALSLRTVDMLPCQAAAQVVQNSDWNAGFSRPAVSLVYRRGDMESRPAKAQPMNAGGRWWTTDNGRVTALAVAVTSKGQITGSVNLCGDSESRIERGSVIGRNISFETAGKISAIKVRQLWTGNVIDDHTLTLASQMPADCSYPPTISVLFQRGR